MNTVESGQGSSLKLSRDAAGITFDADSDALALFASIFSMIQGPQAVLTDDVLEEQIPSGPDGVASTNSLEMTSAPNDATLLPAAAMLTAAQWPTPETVNSSKNNKGINADKVTDASRLVKVLFEAREMAVPDPLTSKGQKIREDNSSILQNRSAKEMLTGAIKILQVLENIPQVDDGVDVQKEGNEKSTNGSLGALVLSSAPDFIGPMPAIDPPSSPNASKNSNVELDFLAKMMPKSAKFIGPMPAINVNSRSISPEFTGPMPLMTIQPHLISQDFGYASVALGVDTHPPSLDPNIKNSSTNPTSIPIGYTSSVSLDAMGTFEDRSRISDDQLFKLPLQEGAKTGSKIFPSDAISLKKAKGIAENVGSVESGAPSLLDANDQIAKAGSKPNIVSRINVPAYLVPNTAIAQFVPKSVFQTQVNSSTAISSNGNVSELAIQGSSTAIGAQSDGQTSGQSAGQRFNGQSQSNSTPEAGTSGGSADRTLLHRLSTEDANWSQAMVKRLISDLRSGVQQVRIILEPQHLGRLDVQLGLRGAGASIRVAASTTAAAKLLSASRGQLSQMLESSGMRLVGFQSTSISAENSNGASHDLHQGTDQQGDKNGGGKQEFANKLSLPENELTEDNKKPQLLEKDLSDGETAVLSILA